LLLLAGLSTAWLLVAAATGIDSGLLYFAPLFALFVPLLRGHYVGEEAIHRLRASRSRPRFTRARHRATVPATSLRRVRVVSGGELLARFIAVRPPPFAASV
jgi:hypothetical protein